MSRESRVVSRESWWGVANVPELQMRRARPLFRAFQVFHSYRANAAYISGSDLKKMGRNAYIHLFSSVVIILAEDKIFHRSLG